MICALCLERLKPLTMICEIVFKDFVAGMTNVKDSLNCFPEVQLFLIYLFISYVIAKILGLN